MIWTALPPCLRVLVAGAGLYYAWFGNAPTPRPTFPGWLLGVAGLLVGFGTSLGSGCIALLVAPSSETWVFIPAVFAGALLHKVLASAGQGGAPVLRSSQGRA